MAHRLEVASAAGVGAEEEEEVRPEMTHKEPNYKNARWLRKRPGAPRWTQKICRLLEGLMEADETQAETDIGTAVGNLWKILLVKERCSQNKNQGAQKATETPRKETTQERASQREKGAKVLQAGQRTTLVNRLRLLVLR